MIADLVASATPAEVLAGYAHALVLGALLGCLVWAFRVWHI